MQIIIHDRALTSMYKSTFTLIIDVLSYFALIRKGLRIRGFTGLRIICPELQKRLQDL